MGKSRAIRAALVFAIFLFALALHSVLGYGIVFQRDGVHFQEPDGYFHMRTVRNMMHHFPARSGFDPYSAMPTGQDVVTGPFYDLAIGTAAWVAGLGSPSPALIDAVGAWFPAVMGALTIVPVFLIGSALFTPTVGLAAAALLAILPGTFLKVTRLGFTDHHVAETFLTTLALLFLIRALQGRRTLLYSLFAGLALGCFLATRSAGAFLIGFIALCAIVQCCWDHLRGEPSRSWLVPAAALFVAGLLFALVGKIVWSDITNLVLWGGLAAIIATGAISHFTRNPRSFAIVFLSIGALGIAALMLFRHEQVLSIIGNVASRQGSGAASTVTELRPLFTVNGYFSWKPVWEEYTSSWFFALPALGFLMWECLRKKSPALNLFIAWSAFMLVLGLMQNRNCYYLVVNVAILTGWACWQLVRMGRVYEKFVVAGILAAILIVPTVAPIQTLAAADGGPSSDWVAAFAWLRNQTPEPFGDPSAFDRFFPKRTSDAPFPYPASAYGIMNWWDYGHWISAEGRRIPVSNGMQTGAVDAARYYLATNPEIAGQLLQRTRTRYVIADSSLLVPLADDIHPGVAKMLAMPKWIESEPTDLAEPYLSKGPEGETKVVMLFYPAYYQTMVARLYLFDGGAEQPEDSTWVIGYSEETKAHGYRQRTITSTTRYKTYEEAQRHFESIRNEPFVLAGMDPLRTCIPLKSIPEYQLRFSSQPGRLGQAGPTIHAVKIFEYALPAKP
jgi:dolichyl-diphosphooligosaccharide--protein glycosyltransferase